MSNEKQESLADILADMRQGMNPNGTAECQYLESDICTLADRIEAAAKREREAAEADALAVGGVVEAGRHTPRNAAEMREALCDILTAAFAAILRYGNSDKEMQRLAICADNARDALSAPARNCDLPLVVDVLANNNADKAWWVFKQAHPDAYFDVPGLMRCIEWLLAPVAGQKGEGDEQK